MFPNFKVAVTHSLTLYIGGFHVGGQMFFSGCWGLLTLEILDVGCFLTLVFFDVVFFGRWRFGYWVSCTLGVEAPNI